MAQNYSINIAVSNRGGSSSGAGASKYSSAREMIAQAREAQGMRDEHGAKGKVEKGSGPNSSIGKLDKSINLLTKEIKRLHDVMHKGEGPASGGGTGGGGSGGGGGRGGGPGARGVAQGFSSGMGAGISALGQSIGNITFMGIPGALISSLGYMWNQVSQVGHAAAGLRQQQLGTAGVAGIQFGDYSYYTGAEMGQLVKARRTEAGMLGERTDERFKSSKEMMAEARIAAIARKVRAPVDDFLRREGYSEVDLSGVPAAVEAKDPMGRVGAYARTYGIGADTIGKQLGLFDVGSGGKGDVAMNQTLWALAKGGSSTEIPKIMTAIADTMEESVKSGLDASNVGQNLARQVNMFKAVTPNGRADAAIAITKGSLDVQRQVAQGSWTGFDQFQMAQTAQGMITGKGADADEIRKRLVQSGALSSEAAKQLSEGKGISGDEIQYATQSFLANPANSGEVTKAYFKKNIGLFSGSGQTYTQNLAQFHKNAQAMLGIKDPTQSKIIFDSIMKDQAPDRLKTLEARSKALDEESKAATAPSGKLIIPHTGLNLSEVGVRAKRMMARSPEEIKREQETIAAEIEQTKKLMATGSGVSDEMAMKSLDTGGNRATQAQQMDIQKQNILLSGSADAMVNAVSKVEESTLKLATSVAALIAGPVETFGSGLSGMVDGINWAVKKLHSTMGSGAKGSR